jgi:predicted nucleic acid-binding protein
LPTEAYTFLLTLPDSQIAATALAHDLVLVTRNVKDYAGTGLAVLNQWDQA